MNIFNKNSRLFIFAILIVWLGCQNSHSKKLTIATAANMQFAMSELTETFSQSTGIKCETVVSSSGKLTAQIQAGAPFDVFVSADRKYPEILFENNLVLAPPKIYAYGNLALWSIVDNISPSLDILTNDTIKHIALANPKNAPYGAAAIEVLRHHELLDALKDKLVYGESIAQVNQFVDSQAAELGFTSLSVVLSPTLKEKGNWIKIDTSIYSPIEQGVVVLKKTDRAEDAQRFVDFLFSSSGQNVLRKYGYEVEGE